MVEGRLVGPQFMEGFGLVEDGGPDKTDLGHKVMLKDEKLRREERKEIKKLHFYESGAKIQVRIKFFLGLLDQNALILFLFLQQQQQQ